jgi:catechol 2,3-dioxygenase-like lactoylglutathione lyase family enzyme
MIDHTGISVSDMERSKRFYTSALAAIGYALLRDFPASVTGHTDAAGYGAEGVPDFWLSKGPPNDPPIHIAFRARNREQVDAFYAAAIAAGGKDNGKPGLRPQYHANYYGAFVLDPDGHNVEAVCHDSGA